MGKLPAFDGLSLSHAIRGDFMGSNSQNDPGIYKKG
jgi:hypothetical protein